MDPYWVEKGAGVPTPAGPTSQTGLPSSDGSMLPSLAWVLLAIAGVAGGVASVSPWMVAEIRGIPGVPDELMTAKGISYGWEGKATIVLGVICLVLVGGWLSRRDLGSLRAALPVGLVMAAISGYTLLTMDSEFIAGGVTEFTTRGMPPDQARGLVVGLVESGKFTITPQTWMYVVIGAGIVAAVAGSLAILSKPPSQQPTSLGR